MFSPLLLALPMQPQNTPVRKMRHAHIFSVWAIAQACNRFLKVDCSTTERVRSLVDTCVRAINERDLRKFQVFRSLEASFLVVEQSRSKNRSHDLCFRPHSHGKHHTRALNDFCDIEERHCVSSGKRAALMMSTFVVPAAKVANPHPPSFFSLSCGRQTRLSIDPNYGILSDVIGRFTVKSCVKFYCSCTRRTW